MSETKHTTLRIFKTGDMVLAACASLGLQRLLPAMSSPELDSAAALILFLVLCILLSVTGKAPRSLRRILMPAGLIPGAVIVWLTGGFSVATAPEAVLTVCASLGIGMSLGAVVAWAAGLISGKNARE